jgi:serine/threonine protein kinase
MQPPLSVGTLLQSRYRLMKILGQGGFGRTYLAADQGRFHEACVIKEFIPITGSPQALEKSKELFQREAQILHQIQHPQIPRFLATFEQDQRFFIVQDFVDGRVYSDLLSERLQQGQKFSEAEVLHFLEQMLPVLAYIHSKGIIHRDIAPDNIILRSSDHLPVLIDFGIVKDLASQAGAATDMPSVQGTTVGKLGYAPREQLQTGKSYPSSDLYALAVTTVVLLTARPPQDLVDEMTMAPMGTGLNTPIHQGAESDAESESAKPLSICDRGTPNPEIADRLDPAADRAWQPILISSIAAARSFYPCSTLLDSRHRNPRSPPNPSYPNGESPFPCHSGTSSCISTAWESALGCPSDRLGFSSGCPSPVITYPVAQSRNCDDCTLDSRPAANCPANPHPCPDSRRHTCPSHRNADRRIASRPT